MAEQGADRKVINAVLAFKKEAHKAKEKRIRKNNRNRQAYENLQDWSDKMEGQSTEFLPKTAETVDQFAAFIKRALVQFGDWFSVEAAKSPISEDAIKTILQCYTQCLPDGNGELPFVTRIADGTKVALLEAGMIFKVHGRPVKRHTYRPTDDGELEQISEDQWRLFIDLIPPEDYYPDPTGRGLYEIHSVERDLHDVVAMAEAGIYDKAEVAKITEDMPKKTEERRRENDDTDQPLKPEFRKRVVITEFWGTLLDKDGKVTDEKVLCTVANDKYLIRKPEPWPFWHGMTPFTYIPLIRLPFSVFHKALYDDVVSLNLAINELFNLMLDGGIASVWGIKQLHLDYLEDPTQAAGGIPQGTTLALREDVPPDAKVLEQVTTGEVPRDALAMFQILDREFLAGAKSNDLKMGMLPPRQVKATEVVEASQSSAVLTDSIVADMERKIEEVLSKAFLTIMQFADNIQVGDLVNKLDRRDLIQFMSMNPAQRFATFAGKCAFKVFGLSATLARARDFQRIMAVLQVAGQSPILLPALLRTTNPDKLLKRLWKIMNINPADIERKPDDVQNLAEDIQIFQLFQQVEQQASGVSAEAAGEPGLPSEINQEANPTSGL